MSRKSVQAMPTSASQRLYFSTTNGSDFAPKEVPEADENFHEVFAIGQRVTKYMNMPGTGSNLPTWDDVQSRRDFDKKPFLDLQENREIAKLLQQPEHTQPALASEKFTQYARDFKGPTASQLKKIKHDSVVAEEPDNGSSHTLGGKGQWMVSKSLSHEHYRPWQNATRTRSVPQVTSNIEVTPASAKSWRSQNSRTYLPTPGCAPITSHITRARPGRVPPRDLSGLMDGIKKEMQHSFSAPSGTLSVFKRPF